MLSSYVCGDVPRVLKTQRWGAWHRRPAHEGIAARGRTGLRLQGSHRGQLPRVRVHGRLRVAGRARGLGSRHGNNPTLPGPGCQSKTGWTSSETHPAFQHDTGGVTSAQKRTVAPSARFILRHAQRSAKTQRHAPSFRSLPCCCIDGRQGRPSREGQAQPQGAGQGGGSGEMEETMNGGVFMVRSHRGRIIGWLRKEFPAETWTYERYSWGGGDYHTASGWTAGYRSCLAPRWDGDDESCASRFYLYRPGQPTVELYP